MTTPAVPMAEMIALVPERCDHLLVLGAHCDDLAIGAGGTLLTMCRAHVGLRVSALVLTGGGTARECEERDALHAFCPKAQLSVQVLDLPDGRVPAHWERAKLALEELRTHCDPDLVLAPAPHDAHQDHRILAQLVPTAFRRHLVLGYEICKWDGDLAQPQAYLPLTAEVMAEKVTLLAEHYPSQTNRGWFDAEAFTGLARIRGVQCHAPYAEAFHVGKLVLKAAP